MDKNINCLVEIPKQNLYWKYLLTLKCSSIQNFRDVEMFFFYKYQGPLHPIVAKLSCLASLSIYFRELIRSQLNFSFPFFESVILFPFLLCFTHYKKTFQVLCYIFCVKINNNATRNSNNKITSHGNNGTLKLCGSLLTTI